MSTGRQAENILYPASELLFLKWTENEKESKAGFNQFATKLAYCFNASQELWELALRHLAGLCIKYF